MASVRRLWFAPLLARCLAPEREVSSANAAVGHLVMLRLGKVGRRNIFSPAERREGRSLCQREGCWGQRRLAACARLLVPPSALPAVCGVTREPGWCRG